MEKAWNHILKDWWGLLVGLVIILTLTYVTLWTIAEPLGIPDQLDGLPKSRGIYHILITLLVGAYITLALELWARRKAWRDYKAIHHPSQLVGTEGLGYEDIKNGVLILAEYAKTYNPDFIYGINRGGAILGGLLAKQLNKPCVYILTVNYDRAPGKRIIEHRGDKKEIFGKILLVDDAIRKGDHMREAAVYLKSRYGNVEIRSAVLLKMDVPHFGPEESTFHEIIDLSVFRTNQSSALLPWDIQPFDPVISGLKTSDKIGGRKNAN